MDIKNLITNGETALGIELGSTRIKAVLTLADGTPVASGGHSWENRYENDVWTYSYDDIIGGIKSCYSSLISDVKKKYGVIPTTYGAMGVSAMMHGYIALDKNDNLLVPFRTWRNTITEKASTELTEMFQFPIPQRWSIAHLYQSILEKQEHLKDISHLTTLAGFVHYLLTGKRVLGIGEASGMFPVDSAVCNYNEKTVALFDKTASKKGFDKGLMSLLPEVLTAGENAGTLTESGAKLLDESGTLKAGVPFCPPEGDAGTGMVATNSVKKATGNVSAGTSVFAMVVLEKPLSKAHTEIDIVTTPSGDDVAMVHCNNCTSELNAWAGIFREFAQLSGLEITDSQLYNTLFKSALAGDKACKGLFACNYLSGEHVTGFSEGRPFFARTPDSSLTLGSFMRAQLYTSLGALKTGLDILMKEENVKVGSLTGHGGFFKTEKVGASILAGAVNAPVSVMSTAGEGGAWGMAVLAGYSRYKAANQSLTDYLDSVIFKNADIKTVQPDPEDVKGFEAFMENYRKGLAIEKAAVENI